MNLQDLKSKLEAFGQHVAAIADEASAKAHTIGLELHAGLTEIVSNVEARVVELENRLGALKPLEERLVAAEKSIEAAARKLAGMDPIKDLTGTVVGLEKAAPGPVQTVAQRDAAGGG